MCPPGSDLCIVIEAVMMMMGMKMMSRMVVMTAEKMEFWRSSQPSRGTGSPERNGIKVNVCAVMCRWWVLEDRE